MHIQAILCLEGRVEKRDMCGELQNSSMLFCDSAVVVSDAVRMAER